MSGRGCSAVDGVVDRRRISELERKVFALTQALDGEAKSDTRSEEGPK